MRAANIIRGCETTEQSRHESASALLSLRAGTQLLGISLTEAQFAQFAVLAKELAEWNAYANLTAITALEDIEVKHLVDSLTVVPWLRTHLPPVNGSIIDVGSGAGFPGLVLAVVLPTAQVTLLEATRKKVDFLRHAIEALGLDNTVVMLGRAEEVARDETSRDRFDVAIARALGSVATLVELLMPLVRVDGFGLMMKTETRLATELDSARFAFEELQSCLEDTLKVDVPGLLNDRAVVVVRKLKVTPERYPRRSGLPQRRPLR